MNYDPAGDATEGHETQVTQQANKRRRNMDDSYINSISHHGTISDALQIKERLSKIPYDTIKSDNVSVVSSSKLEAFLEDRDHSSSKALGKNNDKSSQKVVIYPLESDIISGINTDFDAYSTKDNVMFRVDGEFYQIFYQPKDKPKKTTKKKSKSKKTPLKTQVYSPQS